MMTKELIAQELKVPKERLAIIPQISFHIDKDICVDPTSRLVFIRDEQQVIDHS
jgi:hypothetical protein